MKKSKVLLAAAVAGILGAAGSARAMDKKDGMGMKKDASKDNVSCYGVNKCKAMGKCGGEASSCAGTNACKGMGWLPMPKDSCLAIDGGSLEPKKKS